MDEDRLAAGAGNGRGNGADLAAAPRAARSGAAARRGAPVSRHGAIARDLIRFASYQLWAERVRTTWQADDGPAGSSPGELPRR